MTVRASCALDETRLCDEKEEFNLANCEEKLSFARSGKLVLEVVDTGAGMTPAQVAKLFRKGIQFDVNDLVRLLCSLCCFK